MSRNRRIAYGVFLLIALLLYLFLPNREWGVETNVWYMLDYLIDIGGDISDYGLMLVYLSIPVLALIILFISDSKDLNGVISLLWAIPVIISISRRSWGEEDIYINSICYAVSCLIGSIIVLSGKNEKASLSEEEIQKKEANKKWWKKWWWAVALVFIVAEVVQYKVSELTEKPAEEYGSTNTPTIADFADEVVRWISVVDVDDNFRDLEKEHSLDVQLEPYNEIVLKDISYGSYDLKLTASFGEFQKSRKAVPYQYDIFISFPYSRNLIEKYKQLYDELAKRLEYGESVEFRYNDTDIETMFDGNGFRITLGKDLYLLSQDDWSQW